MDLPQLNFVIKLSLFLKSDVLTPLLIILLGGLLVILGQQILPSSGLVITSQPALLRQNLPQQILIPKLGINKEVVKGGIREGQWILSDSQVLFLPSSSTPEQGYNTIMYAHKRRGLFGDLSKLSLGDQIIVTDKSNQKYSYTIYFKKVINPDEVEALQTSERNTLTLFTCDGIFDQQRLLIRAKLPKWGLTSQTN